MQDTNILLTQAKTTLFDEAAKVKPQGNISKNNNMQQGHAFVDLLFSDHMATVNYNANNTTEVGLNNQKRHDPPVLAETRKSDSPVKPNDSSTDYGNYNQEGYQDINDEDSDSFVSQNGTSDIVVKENDRTDIKDNEDSVATAEPGNESQNEPKPETIQEDGDLNSDKDISHQESVTNSKDEKVSETVDKSNKDDHEIKLDIMSEHESDFASVEGKDVNVKEVKSDIITKLESVFAAIDGKDVRDVKSEIISKLKEVFAGVGDGTGENEGKEVKADIITKLESVFAAIDGKDVRDVKSEIISKLKEVFAGIEENGGKAVRADIVEKREGLFSKDTGVRNKNEGISVVPEKNVEESNKSNNYGKNEKNNKIVKSGEGDTDRNLLKGIVERLDENKSEKIINKEKNIEKKHIVNDTASNGLNNAKVSDKTKKSTDGSSKSTGDSSFTFENETGAEARVSKDGNRIDTLNSDRDIKVEQRVVSAQGAKSDLTDQRQNKNKFANRMRNGKSDNGNLQRTDSDQQIVNGKTQTIFRSETASQVNKTPASARTIPKSQLGETIVRNAKQFQKGGNSEIHLTIKKPELGNVKLSFVENAKGRLEVTLVAERYETSELIKQNIAEMRQLLQQEGIDLSKFDVFDQDDRNKKHFAQKNSFNNGSRENHSAEDGGLDKDEETILENNDLSVADVGNVNSDDQVNVFV
ncbi:MAG: flagellar hook-length control protein FliK [Candidatus Anammoxibacter sp.]